MLRTFRAERVTVFTVLSISRLNPLADAVPNFFLINIVYGELSVKLGTGYLQRDDLSQVFEIHGVGKT